MKTKAEMKQRINEHKAQRRERVTRLKQQKQELKSKIRELQEKRRAKHDDEVTALDKLNRGLRDSIRELEQEKRYWERVERFNMRQNLSDLQEAMERTKTKYELRIKAMTEECKKHVRKMTGQRRVKRCKNNCNKKLNHKQECQSFKLVNDRLQRKLDFYKSKHNRSTMQIEKMKSVLKNAGAKKAKQQTREREQKRRSERKQQENKRDDLFSVDRSDVISELPIVPTVYCADQKHCMKGDDGIMEEDLYVTSGINNNNNNNNNNNKEEEMAIVNSPHDFMENVATRDMGDGYTESTTYATIDIDGKQRFFQIIKYSDEKGEMEQYHVRSLNEKDVDGVDVTVAPVPREIPDTAGSPIPPSPSLSDQTSPPPSPGLSSKALPPSPSTGSQSPSLEPSPSKPLPGDILENSFIPEKPVPPKFLREYEEVVAKNLRRAKDFNNPQKSMRRGEFGEDDEAEEISIFHSIKPEGGRREAKEMNENENTPEDQQIRNWYAKGLDLSVDGEDVIDDDDEVFSQVST